MGNRGDVTSVGRAGGRRATTIVLGTTVAVAAVALVAGVRGELWAFELLAVGGLLVGIALAAGWLEVRPATRADVRWAEDPSALTAAVTRRLERLDRVEHARLQLAPGWPEVVVGPSGVTVIAAARRQRGVADELVRRTVLEARRVLDRDQQLQHVPVRGVVVVDRQQDPGRSAAREPRHILAQQLSAALDHGALLARGELEATIARLGQGLAPDLRPL